MGDFKLFGKRKSRASPSSAPLDDSAGDKKNTAEYSADIQHFANTTCDDQRIHFSGIGISQWLIGSLATLAIRKPTPVQSACIPQVLAGRNVIGSAKTGSGKTAAFALPIIQKLAEDPYGVFALVITPTRELAFQIAEQFKALGDGVSLRQCVVVGGMDFMQQALNLQRKPHIVIATPGRLRDHLQSSGGEGNLFKRLRFLVFDEADRLLEATFASDLDVILSHVPSKRQTLLFTATITPELEALKNERTFVYSAQERHDTVQKLDQRFIMTPSLVRDSYLIWVLQNVCMDKNTIIFVGKCLTCELLRFMLYHLEFKVTALHSKMTQAQRINSLARFRTGVCTILISTDVGSRGLDIPEVQYVVNYDVPCSATDYVHRVGRTARAGRGGKAITLMTEIDVDLILNIERKTGKKLVEEPVNEAEINDQLKRVAEAKREASMHLLDSEFGEKSRINALKRSSASKPAEEAKRSRV